MKSQYMITRQRGSTCPNKCGPIDLLASRSPSHVPWFHFCFRCGYVGEVGVGVVRKGQAKVPAETKRSPPRKRGRIISIAASNGRLFVNGVERALPCEITDDDEIEWKYD